jgi:predicted enzyme related to lactoylglutathione lyase
MKAHVSSILLGVEDMDRSKRFYTEGLGWEVQNDYKISVFFVPHGGSLVGFYGRNGLADMVGASPEGSGFSGVVFNYVVRSEDRVDEVLNEAKKAGGKILKPAAELQWGGYGGSFADPDGYIWNIGYSARERTSPTRSSEQAVLRCPRASRWRRALAANAPGSPLRRVPSSWCSTGAVPSSRTPASLPAAPDRVGPGLAARPAWAGSPGAPHRCEPGGAAQLQGGLAQVGRSR